MRRFLIIALFVFATAGCTLGGFQLVEPGSEQTVIREYTLKSGAAWNKVATRNAELWTRDGFGLQAVEFFEPRSDGEALFRKREAGDQPVFRADMRPNAVMEYVVDSLAANGIHRIKPKRLKPYKFGGRRGFRFELDYTGKSGLEYSSIAVGAVIDGQLYLVVYTGAKEFYFGRDRKQVERMLRSIRFTS